MKPDVREMQHRVRAEIAMPSRLAHSVLLVAAAAMTATVASLWITESSLPERTQWAFAFLIVIGAGWISFASWVLTRRRVLFGQQRVVAARLALIATAAFVAGAITLREQVGIGAVATSVVMFAVAAAAMITARGHVKRLEAKMQSLQREVSR